MDLLKETNKKIDYLKKNKEDLQKCLQENLTIDCRRYVNEELSKIDKKLEYYNKVFELIKGACLCKQKF